MVVFRNDSDIVAISGIDGGLTYESAVDWTMSLWRFVLFDNAYTFRSKVSHCLRNREGGLRTLTSKFGDITRGAIDNYGFVLPPPEKHDKRRGGDESPSL
jgi:hypothetical protein